MTDTGKSSRPARSNVPTTPEEFPTTPSNIPLAALDQSFVIQMMLDLKGSVAALKESVDSLKEQSKDHGTEIRKIGQDVHAAKVVVSVVGALLLGAIALIGWVAKAYLDYLAVAPHKP